MTTFDEAVTLARQLSPVEQARLVALLAERLQKTLSEEPSPITASVAVTDEPAFWHIPIIDAEWATPEATGTEPRQTSEVAQAETKAMLARWFGGPLPEEDALDLAMSEAITEWNMDR